MTKKNEVSTGGFALTTFEQVEAFAEKVATSGMLGPCTKAQAFVITEHCAKKGLSVLEFKQRYHTTKEGNVLIRTDHLQSNFQAMGGTIRWIETTDKIATAAFTYGANVDWEQSYTWEQAKRAGLTNKEAYKAHPEDLLRKNLVAKVVNAICPAAKEGCYTEAEMPDGMDGNDRSVPRGEPVAVDVDVNYTKETDTPSREHVPDDVEDAEEVPDTDPSPFDKDENAAPVDFSVCPMSYRKQDKVPFADIPVDHLEKLMAAKHPMMEPGHYEFVTKLIASKEG